VEDEELKKIKLKKSNKNEAEVKSSINNNIETIENDSEKKLEKKKKLNQKKKKQRLERKKRQQEDVEDQKLLDLIS